MKWCVIPAARALYAGWSLKTLGGTALQFGGLEVGAAGIAMTATAHRLHSLSTSTTQGADRHDQ